MLDPSRRREDGFARVGEGVPPPPHLVKYEPAVDQRRLYSVEEYRRLEARYATVLFTYILDFSVSTSNSRAFRLGEQRPVNGAHVALYYPSPR